VLEKRYGLIKQSGFLLRQTQIEMKFKSAIAEFTAIAVVPFTIVRAASSSWPILDHI